MSDDSLTGQARTLLNRIIASGEAADVENADSFVVVATDPENGRNSYCGPYADPVEAMRAASAWEAELNSALTEDEQPYVTRVSPMMSPPR